MKFNWQHFHFLLLITLIGCSPRDERIDGSIFIVTQRGESFKLGLVTVLVFDKQQIESFLAKNTVDLQNKLNALKTDLQRLNKEREDLTTKKNEASSVCDLRRNDYDAAIQTAVTTARKFDDTYYWNRERPPERAVFSEEEKRQLETTQKTVARSREIQKQIDDLKRRIDDLDMKKLNILSSSSATDQKKLDDFNKLQEDEIPLKQELSGLRDHSVEIDLDNLQSLQSREQIVSRLQTMWDQFYPEFLKETNEVKRLQTEWENAKKKMSGFNDSLRENQTKLDFGISQLQNWQSVQPQTYLNNLQPPLITAKTDADGRFSFQLPQKHEFIFIAQAQRQIMDGIEKYFWVVAILPDGKTAIKVMLSNDNLITANSADSAVKFPMP